MQVPAWLVELDQLDAVMLLRRYLLEGVRWEAGLEAVWDWEAPDLRDGVATHGVQSHADKMPERGSAINRVGAGRAVGLRSARNRRVSAEVSCYIGSNSKTSTAHFPSLLDRRGRPSVSAFAAARSSASTIV